MGKLNWKQRDYQPATFQVNRERTHFTDTAAPCSELFPVPHSNDCFFSFPSFSNAFLLPCYCSFDDVFLPLHHSMLCSHILPAVAELSNSSKLGDLPKGRVKCCYTSILQIIVILLHRAQTGLPVKL